MTQDAAPPGSGEHCDFFDEAPGHFSCLLLEGHHGDHRGRELGCGPLICDHVAPLLDHTEANGVLTTLEDLGLGDLVDLSGAIDDEDLERFPPGALRRAIDALCDEGRKREALAVSYYAWRGFPDDDHVARQHARLLAQAQRWAQALEINEDLSRRGHLDEMRAGDQAAAARCLIELEEPERALRYADEALMLAPDGYAIAEARLARAAALVDLDRLDEALSALDLYEVAGEARGFAKHVRVNCLIAMAKKASRDGAEPEALAAAWRAALAATDAWLLAEPRVVSVHRQRAGILRRLERPAECIAALDRYEAVLGPDAETTYWRAEVLSGSGRAQDCVELCRTWIEKHPEDNMVYWALADALEVLGRKPEAWTVTEEYEAAFGRDVWSAAMILGLAPTLNRWEESYAAAEFLDANP